MFVIKDSIMKRPVYEWW